MAMRVTEGLVRRAGGLTDGFLQTNGRCREPVAMSGVALLRIGRLFGPADGLCTVASGQVGAFSLKGGV